jgi:hypothetical protein
VSRCVAFSSDFVATMFRILNVDAVNFEGNIN